MLNYNFRHITKDDYRAVEELVRDSFWNVYRPGCLEHYVVHTMRSSEDYIPELEFVMTAGDRIIGQNVFFKAHIDADDGRQIPIMTMGPICIANDLKRQGYGKLLLDYTIERAAEYGCTALCFEGNIDFYGKSGFDYARNFGLRYHGLPEGEDDSFFLCKEIVKGYFDGITGVYSTPSLYFIDENECEEFDKTFPPKQKLTLPTRLNK